MAMVASAETFTVDGVEYSLLADGSGVEVKGCTLTGDIVIPATVKNGAVTYKVTGVGTYAFSSSEANSITLPNTVVTIESGAFQGCSCKSVDLGQGVEVIKSDAFNFSRSLESLSVLPACLKTIEVNPFPGLDDLKAIEVDEANPYFKSIDGVLFTKGGTKLISYPYGKGTKYVIPEGTDTIGNSAFNTFQAMEEITFPSTLKVVQGSAFIYCRNMVSTNDLPEGLEYIGASSFSNCRVLNITLPSTLTYLGYSAFNNARGITSIHIPGAIETVPSNCFNNAWGLTSVTFDEGVKVIDDFAFQYANLSEIKLPESLTTIGSYAFNGNSNAKAVVIGKNVTTIAVCAFNGVIAETYTCRAEVPPTYTHSSYAMVSSSDKLANTILYVPKGTVDAYKAAWMWSLFPNIQEIEDGGSAGIDDLNADADVVAKQYFDINGMEVAAPSEADGKIYIVVSTSSNGTKKAQKILNR